MPTFGSTHVANAATPSQPATLLKKKAVPAATSGAAAHSSLKCNALAAFRAENENEVQATTALHTKKYNHEMAAIDVQKTKLNRRLQRVSISVKSMNFT